MALQIVSTRNGVSPVSGYREDLVAGDLISVALSSTVGVTQVRWELLGRPEGSAAGGAGPEPILLPSGLSTSFTVDSDSGDFRLDGSYKVQATINPGSPGERRVDTILCRLAGVTIPGPASSVRLLRKLAGFEALEDTSLPEVLQGWATQLNRWLELLRGVATGGAGGFTTLEGAYANGATASDQTLVLHDAVGGAVIIDATQGDFTGASAFKVVTPGGNVVVDRATGRVGIGTTAPAKPVHIASSAPAVRLDRTGGAALDIANVGDELQFLNGALVLTKLEPTGGLRADLGVGIGVAPATAPVLALGAASSAAISGAGTARFRYNEITGHAEWSENGGPYQPFSSAFSAYTTVDDAGTPLTQRSVINAVRPLVATDNAGASRTDLSLSIDGTLGVTGGALSRAALTGDVTAAAGSNATAFRSFTGASVLARAAGTSGAPADLAATVDGQVLQRAAGALSWAPLAYSSLTGIPTFFYQTMSAAGVALTQRVALNADGTVVMSDDVADGWTTIGLPHVGPGAQTIGGNGVSSVSFDDYGRITGATAASYLSTINGIMAGGDLTGSYPNPQLAPKGATVGQALVWDGTGWNPGTVATTAFYQTMQSVGLALPQRNALNADGTVVMVDDPSNSWTTIGLPFILTGQTFGGTGIASLTIDNFGRVTGAIPGRFLSTITGIMAGGDLTGSYPNPQIDQKGATAGQALTWSGTGWTPATIAPAGPPNTAAYFNGGGVLAGAPDQAANIAAAEALPGASYRDGARVRVTSLNDDFFLHVNNGLTVDHIDVLSVSGLPNARWIRREGGRRAEWATTYFLDPVFGDDQNDGLSGGTALKTAAELGRRLKDCDLSSPIVIKLNNNLPDSDPITIDTSPVGGVPSLSIVGGPTVVASGLVASATAANYGANQLNQITITGFNWAPYVGSIVRLQGTSGDTGTYAIVVKDLGSGTALLGIRVVSLSVVGGGSFGAGQTIEVLSYPTIPGVFLSGAQPVSVSMSEIRIARASAGTIRLAHSSVNSTLRLTRCVVDGATTSNLNSTFGTLTLFTASLRSLTTVSARGLALQAGSALVNNGQATISNSALSVAASTFSDSVTWGSPLNFGDFADVVLTTRSASPTIGFGVFGLAASQIGIQTGRQASLYADWLFGGSNDPASYVLGLSRNAKFTNGNFGAITEASSAGAVVGYSNPTAPFGGSQTVPLATFGGTASINSIDRGAGPSLAAASQISPAGLTMFRSWTITGTTNIGGMTTMPFANTVPSIATGLSIEFAIHDGVTFIHDSGGVSSGFARFNLADHANETLPAGSRIRFEFGLNAAGTNNGWVETWRSTVGGDLAGSTPNPTFRNFAATSVLANATGSPARPTDLAASADGQVLTRVSGALVWTPAFYQTVVVGSTTEPQRLQLGFSTAFTGTDSSSPSRTTIGLATTGVTAGTYTNTTLTVGADGRITAASNGAGGASFYQTVSSNGSALAQRGTLNFSTAFSVADNVGAGRTDVSLATNGTTLTNLQQIAANSILMNPTAAPANVQAISLGTTSGVLQYVNGTTDSFGVYAAGVSRIPFGSGGSGQLTDDAHMKFNGFTFGVTSQQELQLYNDGTGASDFTGVRLGTASNFSRSFYFQQLGQSVTSGAGLAPNNGLLELNASTATLVISNIGGGDISIATGASRTSRIDVTAGGNVQVSSLSSGGVVKAAVTTGQLSIAFAGTDYVQTVSVSALQLVNGGTSANPVLGLATTGASGSYTNANITVDLWGRITAASSGSAGAAFYQTVENAATGLAQRAALNFSTGLTAVDNAGAGRTDVTANLSTGISGGQSVIGGTAASEALTLTSTASGTKGKINIGSSGSVGVIDENAGLVAIGQLTPDGRIHVVMPDDTGLGSTTAWNSSFAVFGRSGANAGSLGVSTTVGSTSVNLSALAPSNAWWNMRINAHTLAVYADGSTLGFSQDALANVTIARALTLTSITGPALLWVSAIGGVGTVTGPQSATLAYDYNLCDFTGIGKTNAGLFSGATQAYGVLGAGPLFMSTSGASTSTCEYGLNVSATTIAVRAHVVRNDLSGGTGTMQWNVTRNGAATTTTLFITEGAGTQDVVVTGTVSGSASDTWGLDFTNGTGATGGAFTGSVTLTVSAV